MPDPDASPRLPCWGEYDVVVCGGGVAGVSAAVAAARNGATTALIEKSTVPGGLATAGLIVFYLPLCDGRGRQVIGGFAEDLLKRALTYCPGAIPSEWNKKPEPKPGSKLVGKRFQARFDPAAMALAMEDLLLEAGVALVYDSLICDVVRHDNRIHQVMVQNKSGMGGFRSRMVVDATGDAAVGMLAGDDIHVSKTNTLAAWFYSYDGTGDVRLHTPMAPPNSAATYDGTDWRDVSRFAIDARRAIREHLARQNTSQATRRYPLVIPSTPGFRMTRGVIGRADFNPGHCPEDCVAMFGDWRKAGPVYPLPYPALLPSHTENLIAAGRTVFGQAAMWEVLRAIPVCALTGEVAGTAAAMGCEHRLSFSEIDATALRRRLQSQGVLLNLDLMNAASSECSRP